jgi:hypothetical protein
MSSWWWLVGLLVFPLQVPRPSSSTDEARELEAARRSILVREAAELSGLAGRLAGQGEPQAAEQVRAQLPRPVAPNGPTRFVPLPDLVAPPAAGTAQAWRGPFEEIRSRSAAELFELAKRAAQADPPRYSLASVCLREVMDRQPGHSQARRLLGYVPYQGGWAKPFVVKQLRQGLVNHSIFGWVKADWVPHLDRGELPSPPTRGRVRWLPAAEADRLRARWKPAWEISTEHFKILTNVPLAEVISFGRRLEAFHDLFMTLLADILGDNLPLVRRFHDPSLVGEPASELHIVWYFASKDEFVAALSPKYGDNIAESLGFYYPPKSKRGGRTPAYFFHDPGGQLPVTANLYHEVSHQLLFETAGPNAYTRNAGNYWVFEGMGTYFETVEPQPDGSLEVGGLVGRRLEEAIKSLVDQGQGIPLSHFIALDDDAFMRQDRQIYLRYQQAMALTVFLMQWHQGTYRDSFLDYVHDAYRGRIKQASGHLQERLGQSYETLQAQFLAFLKQGRARPNEGQPVAAQPASNGSIRTVPRQ